MKLSITTLSENMAVGGNVLAEWGLSILAETDETNVLLDTGQSISASHNASIYEIDLSKVDRIIISHGHYDHSGGLRHVLRQMRKEVEIIAHPDIRAAKYGRGQGDNYRYIGIPFQREELDVQRAGVSHCTGLPAAAIMAQELGDRFFYNNAGTRINLPQGTNSEPFS